MKTLSLAVSVLLAVSFSGVAQRACAQNEDAPGARKVISRVQPQYPQIARSMNLSGAVKLEVTVNANGTVKSVQTLGGNPVLAQSAEMAVRGWKWERTDHESTEHVLVEFHP
jgi:TonB family protein